MEKRCIQFLDRLQKLELKEDRSPAVLLLNAPWWQKHNTFIFKGVTPRHVRPSEEIPSRWRYSHKPRHGLRGRLLFGTNLLRPEEVKLANSAAGDGRMLTLEILSSCRMWRRPERGSDALGTTTQMIQRGARFHVSSDSFARWKEKKRSYPAVQWMAWHCGVMPSSCGPGPAAD